MNRCKRDTKKTNYNQVKWAFYRPRAFAQNPLLPYNLEMTNIDKLTTDSYKGVRDFYPEDMAIQRYIFDVWSQTAESFGFERYDASILEPSKLYRSKTSDEIVNEQTYTFIDRGNREVTLRPEMTPTVARMIAKKRRELTYPVRWYSIPNLFRYERPQKGRLREHWQLNCDMFGADDYTADVEMVALAYRMLLNFGADASMFEIRINNRVAATEFMQIACDQKLTDEQVTLIVRLNDKQAKIDDYEEQMEKIVGKELAPQILNAYQHENRRAEIFASMKSMADITQVLDGLTALGIENAKFDNTLSRGFDYYTGTIFEIFDVSGENNRSMLGGGRYDNLTALFGGDPVSGIGFGMGDVTMRDFLETHDLLTSDITAPTLMIIPTDAAFNLEGQIIAQKFRNDVMNVAVDISTKKVGKKIADAAEAFVMYALVLGENEVGSDTYVVKNLTDKTESTGTIAELIANINS